MANPHHRHQTSLESVIDFSITTASLSENDRSQAKLAFDRIINYCSSHEPSGTPRDGGRRYERAKLVKLVYEHAISEAGQDNILRYFLSSMVTDSNKEKEFSRVLTSLIDFDDWDVTKKESIMERVRDFADHLVDGFFLPLRASSKKTPQPTPAFSSLSTAVPAGTTERLSALRGKCLIRDRHRCVISRRFDATEAQARYRNFLDDAKDDDGRLLKNEEEDVEYLEVAHIIPHSLASLKDPSKPLNDAKQYTLRVLEMFDPGIIHQIGGVDIDRPYNALTLTHNLHQRFGELSLYFEPVLNAAEPHTYTIQPTISYPFYNRPKLPLTRTLFITFDRVIDPPSPRLLAIHRACALILHLSGAAEFIDKVLRDMDETAVESDGTTELGCLVSLGLRGWDGLVGVY